jgi:hypothetical protein
MAEANKKMADFESLLGLWEQTSFWKAPESLLTKRNGIIESHVVTER